MAVRAVWPLLMVSDLDASRAFWVDRLGFRTAGAARREDGTAYWCRLERGGASVMLQEESGAPCTGAQRDRIELYFVCDDADALHEELVGRGARVEEPTEADYGMRQLFVTDPDGHPVCFESPTEAWRG